MSGKKYSIKSTPTIFINEKKYDGSHNYIDFKKEIEKIVKMKFKRLDISGFKSFLIKPHFLLRTD